MPHACPVRLTKFVQFLPGGVISGFLASVGFLTIEQAISITTGSELEFNSDCILLKLGGWEALLPALALGLGLWGCNQFHVSKPAVL